MWLFYPNLAPTILCVLEDPHDHKVLIRKPDRKVVNGASEDNPPIREDQSLEKDTPQDQKTSKASEAEEQILKELEEQLLLKQNWWMPHKSKKMSLKQRIEEA